MTETLREEEYQTKDGRVLVTVETRDHSNTLDVIARQYDQDDTRMNYYRFALGSKNQDAVDFQSGTTDVPTQAVIAAVHRSGFEIKNVEGTTLMNSEHTDAPEVAIVWAKRTFDDLSTQFPDSEYMTRMLEGLSYLSKIAAVNAFIARNDDLDQKMDEINQEFLEERLGGPEDVHEVLSGIFQSAIESWKREMELDEHFDVVVEMVDQAEKHIVVKKNEAEWIGDLLDIVDHLRDGDTRIELLLDIIEENAERVRDRLEESS